MVKRASGFGGAPALSRRRRTAIALLAAATPLLAACGSNFDAQTNQVYQPAAGVNDRSGDVFVINALVVTDGSGTGVVVAALVNQAERADRLTEVVASSGTGAPLQSAPLGAGIALPPDESVQLADSGRVTVTASAAGSESPEEERGGVTAGSYVTLQFVFQKAPVVEVQAPVVSKESENQDIYEDITISPGAGTQ